MPNTTLARLLVLSALLALAGVAHATTFVVTTTNDTIANGDGVSLREAITAANTNAASGDAPAGSAGLDTITFNIAGAGVHTFSPASTYPAIVEPVLIDGYTQTGASANSLAVGSNAVLLIEINGAGAGTTFQFSPGSTGSTVRGLVLNRASNQVWAVGVGGITYTGNFIGVTPAGTTISSSNTGLRLEDSPNNQIGGTTPGARNVFVTTNLGVWIYETTAPPTPGTAGGNIIQGNYFGTGSTGLAVLPAGTVGNNVAIEVEARANNTLIGGTAAGAGNLISGNTNGIALQTGASLITIQGNVFGLDANGGALGNIYYALNASSGATGLDTLIGGTAAGAGNTFRNNGHGGSFTAPAIFSAANLRTKILGNSIDGTGGPAIEISFIGPNDTNDTDGIQNFPVLTTATIDGIQTATSGTLGSKANTTFRVEIFASPACSTVAGGGEGRTFLGFASVTTDGTGAGTFALPTLPLAAGVLTATATDMTTGGTSNFSACKALTTVTPPDMTVLADMTVLPTTDMALPFVDIGVDVADMDHDEFGVSPRDLARSPADNLSVTPGSDMLNASTSDTSGCGCDLAAPSSRSSVPVGALLLVCVFFVVRRRAVTRRD